MSFGSIPQLSDELSFLRVCLFLTARARDPATKYSNCSPLILSTKMTSSRKRNYMLVEHVRRYTPYAQNIRYCVTACRLQHFAFFIFSLFSALLTVVPRGRLTMRLPLLIQRRDGLYEFVRTLLRHSFVLVSFFGNIVFRFCSHYKARYMPTRVPWLLKTCAVVVDLLWNHVHHFLSSPHKKNALLCRIVWQRPFQSRGPTWTNSLTNTWSTQRNPKGTNQG